MSLVPDSVINECKYLYESSGDIENVLGYLRSRNYSKIAAIKAVIWIANISLAEAKAIVHFSSTWADTQQEDNTFHDSLHTLTEMLQSQSGNALAEYLQPFGPGDYIFQLYCLTYKASNLIPDPKLEDWPEGTSLKRHELWNEPWPMVVYLFEIHAPLFPADYSNLLKTTLDKSMQGDVVISWFMFDGAFNDIQHLFSPWLQMHIYGMALPGQAIGIAVTKQKRESDEWTHLIKNASQHLRDIFPSFFNDIP